MIETKKSSHLFRGVLLTGLIVAGHSAQAIPVDLELSLVIDVSGSVNTDEYNLQMDGYANAFRDADVQNAILNGSNGAIATNVVFFASSAAQGIAFTLLDSFAAIDAFANQLDTIARPFGGGTDIFDGVNFAVPLFGDETGGAANGFESTRQVIDVSGDGRDSVSSNRIARDNALAGGVDTINGLAIENFPGATLITDFYRDNVIGGTDAFVETASGFDTFETAVRNKLRAEIAGPGPTPVPEPATLSLLGLGFVALRLIRRKKAV
ncbi:MAG: DUF1194 domain-containing protein [Gammaproteobacteria bacterium]